MDFISSPSTSRLSWATGVVVEAFEPSTVRWIVELAMGWPGATTEVQDAAGGAAPALHLWPELYTIPGLGLKLTI